MSKEADCDITGWAVYADISDFPYHYVLLLENKDGKDLTPYSQLAHETLCSANPRYGHFYMGNEYGPLTIVNQRPGTHAEWDARKRAATGIADWQSKPIRVLDTPEKEDFFVSRTL